MLARGTLRALRLSWERDRAGVAIDAAGLSGGCVCARLADYASRMVVVGGETGVARLAAARERARRGDAIRIARYACACVLGGVAKD